MPQLGASLTIVHFDSSKGAIYDYNVFIIQATGAYLMTVE
jgi:hypothetical protein